MKFAFPKSVMDLNTVPEDFRGLYAEQDGEFSLRSDDPGVASAVKAVIGLNGALKAARGEASNLKDKTVDLSPLADYGSDPVEIAEKFKQVLDATAKKAGNEELATQLEAQKKELAKAHARALKEKETVAEQLKGRLKSVLVTGEARSALAAAGAIDPELVMPFIERRVNVKDEGGNFTVTVVGDDGTPRFSSETGNEMTIKELVNEMKGQERYGTLFKSDQKSGGGSQGRDGTPTNRKLLTPEDKIQAGIDKMQHQR